MAPAEAPIELVPYDPEWPHRFEQEREWLLQILGPWLAGPIEHIGSTAIPGLAAKPVIDIMAAVRGLEESRPAIEAVATLDYQYFPYKPHQRHWFCKPSPAFRTHHLHLLPLATPEWIKPIAFRDYLRTHPLIAAEYESLKRKLAREFRFDREAYTAAKTPFIDAATDKALAAEYGSGEDERDAYG